MSFCSVRFASWIPAVLATLSWATSAAPVRGTELHVCDCAVGADADCVAGDDGAAGTAQAPWRSYEKGRLAFAGLQPGDAVGFCRGGAWDVSAGTRWNNALCRAEAPCRIEAYDPPWGSGDEERPILRRVDGAHGFAFEDGGDAEHEEGYRLSELDLRGAGSGNGIFLYNDIDDVTIEDVAITGFDIGVHLAGSNPCGPDPDCDGHNDRVVLRRARIADNVSQGWLGGSDGSMIVDSDFEANGTTAVYDHNIYLSNPAGASTRGMRVRGNRLFRSDLDPTGVCLGVSLVAHGRHEDLRIENNEVREEVGKAGQGCWGIAIDPGYGSAEGFTDLVIRGNRVVDVGNTAIGVGSCVRCLIENNVIVHRQGFGVRAIAAPDRDPGAGDLLDDDIVVRNNSIYVGAASGGTAIVLDREGDDHVLVSNAIHYAGTSSSFNCLSADLGPAAYAAIDFNVCHSPSAPGAEWSNGFGSLAQWQAATGFDLSSSLGDPGFTDPVGEDLSAAGAGVEMVDHGHPSLSSLREIGGFSRDANPDQGAYEWGLNGLFADGFESGDTSAWSATFTQ